MKTVGDIKQSIHNKIRSASDSGICNDVYDRYFLIIRLMKEELMDYYSGEQGRKEIQDSPHVTLNVEEAVDLLMQDVDVWLKKGLNINAEITE